MSNQQDNWFTRAFYSSMEWIDAREREAGSEAEKAEPEQTATTAQSAPAGE